MARVLLVEGDAFEAFMAALQLQDMGHDVVGVTDNAREALTMARKAPPDVAVLELMLSGEMDGVDLGNKLREAHGCKLVYMSANEFLRCSLTGGHVMLAKPYEPEELQNVIDAVIQSS